MKKLLSLMVFMLCILDLTAQDTSAIASDTSAPVKPAEKHWTRSSSFNLNFSQVSLHNWVGGGQSSISLSTLSNSSLNYQKGKVSWSNTLDLGYGLVRLGGKNSSFRKSDDKIVLVSKYSYKATDKLKYSSLLDLRTQMAPGFDYLQSSDRKDSAVFKSELFAPAYTVFALGMEYSPSARFYVFLSPLTNKNTIVANARLANEGAFGVEPGNKFRKEFGAYMTARFKDTIMHNVLLRSDLNLFGNYENLKTIDILWENQLIMKVNKYLNVSLTTNLIYDNDIILTRKDGTKGPGLQFKEVFAIGIGFIL